MENKKTNIEKSENAITEENTEENAIQIVEPKMAPQGLTMWNNTDMFRTTYKMAKILASSNIVPQSYRGSEGNCIIAIDMANRMGISPMMVMQNSQVVSNNFSWKGSACKSMVDGCGKYKSSQYVEVGQRGTDTWGYYLSAIDKDGNKVDGIAVDIKMAKAEGWYDRNPKWKNMPELMLKYRCASFFAKTECPAILMGFQTDEELYDIGKTNNEDNNVVTVSLE